MNQKCLFNIVYFSSTSNNTHRFVLKLNTPNIYRIPIELENKLYIDKKYILIVPTYAGGFGVTTGAVPKQVIQFLNDESNRKNCLAVIASGNRNFIDTYCLAGKVISEKLKVKWLYSFELLGTNEDVKNVIELGNNLLVEMNLISKEELNQLQNQDTNKQHKGLLNGK